jgi:serine/threonine-protein kinase
MGEVYKARDTRLERIVAIKVLSDGLVGDAEFRDRFEREARTISQLTHPNICVLHDIGAIPSSVPPAESLGRDGARFLVMEFLDGESLAARLERGPLKIEEALRLAVQVAGALHAAHRAGIVHRDLKPGNVMLVKAGAGATSAPQAKLLDFGLAKHGPTVQGGAGPQPAQSLTAPPTMTSPLTLRGSIVGTLQYMSPEQLEGADADTRSDLFAFGAVLYEIVTGKKAFTGKSQVSVMAAILDHDPPPVTSIAPAVPAALDRLIGKCLAKDPEARWQSAGDLASELEWIAETIAKRSADAGGLHAFEADRSAEAVALQRAAVALKGRVRAWMVAALVLSLVAAGATWMLTRTPVPPKPQPMRFAIVSPAGQPLAPGGADRDIAISADGTKIAYIVVGGGQRQLVLRSIDRIDGLPLRGVENARVPFFAPDGKWIGYFDGNELKKVSVAGGPPISLCRGVAVPRGATWGRDDTIIFATADNSTGLMAVRGGGGEPDVLTKPDQTKRELDHQHPSFLPNGRAVLFTIVGAGGPDNGQIAVFDLESRQSKVLIRGGTQPEYAESGHLVYASTGGLRAVRFDPVKLEVLSDPVPVLDQVTTAGTGAAEFSLSRSGTLVYVPGANFSDAARTLAWLSRDGREEPIDAPPRAYTLARVSPDGKRVAVDIGDQERDLWVLDLSRQPPPLTRLTFDPASDTAPVWTPDGSRIVFRSTRTSAPNLFSRSADGTGTDERLTTSDDGQAPISFTPDGTRLLFVATRPKTSLDILMMAADGKTAAETLVATPYTEVGPEMSPDGHWFLYHSNESGANQVYVRPFPNANAGRWQVSTNGGLKGAWAPSGREIVYIDANGALMSVSVQTAPTFSSRTPTKILDAKFYLVGPGRNYDISRDGQRFLIIKNPRVESTANDTPASMIVVLNWLEELKARLPNP